MPDGRELLTLRDAAEYITALPKAEHDSADWQVAKEVLLLVAERDGPEMLARIAVMKALNRHTLWDAPRLSAWKLEVGRWPTTGPGTIGVSSRAPWGPGILRRMIRKFSHLLKFTVSYRDGLQPIVSAGTLASYCVAAAAASLRSALPMRRCEYCASWFLLHYAPARCCSVSCGAAMANKRTSPHAFRAEEARTGAGSRRDQKQWKTGT